MKDETNMKGDRNPHTLLPLSPLFCYYLFPLSLSSLKFPKNLKTYPIRTSVCLSSLPFSSPPVQLLTHSLSITFLQKRGKRKRKRERKDKIPFPFLPLSHSHRQPNLILTSSPPVRTSPTQTPS